MSERTPRELQHLAAAMAHEVRNPLNSMAIHVELLESRLKKEHAPPEALKSLGVLAAEIERVDKILEQYLTFAGPGEAARVPVDAKQLLSAALAALQPAADKRGVKLELRADALGKWAIDGDAVSEAVAALGSNAIEASPRGGAVVIAARSDGAAGQGEVAISDGGEPIADGDAAKFFHMGSKRSKGGVGLAVAKQIVKGHGGSLTVKRVEGGNVVTLRLPVENDAD